MLDQTNPRAFNTSLKKAVSALTGQKVRVEIINSYKFNQCTWVRVYPEKDKSFDNEFRLAVFDATGRDRKDLRSTEDVCYGNICSRYISAYVKDWEELFK